MGRKPLFLRRRGRPAQGGLVPDRVVRGYARSLPALARLALCAGGAAIVLSCRAFGIGDHILIAVAGALIALLTGVAADRLRAQSAAAERLAQRVAGLEQEIAALRRHDEPVRSGTAPNDTRADESSVPGRLALPAGATVTTIAHRPAVVFGDGTVIVHTLSGYRQFASMADARLYLGPSHRVSDRLASSPST